MKTKKSKFRRRLNRMAKQPRLSEVQRDITVSSFEQGVNAGISPLLIPRNQLHGAVNTTVRGTFVHPRPPFKRITLAADAEKMIADAFTLGTYQGGGYFKPDNTSGSLVSAIAGHAFQFVPTADAATVFDRTPSPPNPADQTQAWLWQAEKWLIWNDGQSNPVFIDAINTTRSNWGVPVPFSTTNVDPFFLPALGQTDVGINFTDTSNLVVGDIITVKDFGNFQVINIVGTAVDYVNITATPVGYLVPAGRAISWNHVGTGLPPGRMGAYGPGRIAMSLTDGQQFVMGDQVGGPSGTPANQYRDSVLQITENLYLLGGGNFRVPGNSGDIQAMLFTATMDVSLGQGPLQVFTPNKVFSCQAPVDRSTWSTVVNPILTESVITNGGLSQNATVNVNSDILTRSIDGIRSIRLGRLEANTWGTTPVSFEVDPRLSKDSATTLRYSSSIVFDNRLLMTTKPKVTPQGVYWQELIAMNFDPVSSLRGKAPSVYDALTWQGLNVFQLFVGQFSGVERAFAFCWNESLGKFELYELLKSASPAVNDNGTQRIAWSFKTASLFKEQPNQRRKFKQLVDGEMQIDKAIGNVDIQVFWIPDQWPCPVPWISFSFCATETTSQKLGFEPRLGLGEAPAPRYNDDGTTDFCDPKHDRALREFFTSQFLFVITGQCEFIGAQFRCVTIPQPDFLQPKCQPVCNQTNVT